MNAVKWIDSLERWLDPLEKRLDSLAVDGDVSRRQIWTSVALNLVFIIPLFAVSFVLRQALGPTGIGGAILLGFAVAYGIVVYLVYRYVTRRRAAPSEP